METVARMWRWKDGTGDWTLCFGLPPEIEFDCRDKVEVVPLCRASDVYLQQQNGILVDGQNRSLASKRRFPNGERD